MSFTQIKYDNSLGNIKCDMCKKNFIHDSTLFIPNQSLGQVCERCYIKFPADLILDCLTLFANYGGWFGKLKDSKVSLEDLILESIDIIKCTNVNIIETNMRLRHKALLYGYLPEALINKIKEMNF